MSGPVRLFWRRGLGQATGAFTTGFAIAVFVAATSVMTVFGIDRAEGGLQTLASIWALAAAQALPALAAFLGMDAWSGERRSGRAALILSTAVSEAGIVWGKYLSVLTLTLLSILLSLVSAVGALPFFSATALAGSDFLHLLFAVLALLLQGTLWCAVSVMLSCLFVRSSAAAATAVLLTVALPRGLWLGALAWLREVAPTLGEMPLDANAVDLASGFFTLATATVYPVLALLALFIAGRAVAATRYVGRAARGLKWSSRLAVVLAVVVAALVQALVWRFGIVIEVPSFGSRTEFSERTRRILADADGEIVITSYLSRHDPRFRGIAHFLRSLAHESVAVGGARIAVRYVDPRWDLVNAERLVRSGVSEESLVFEKGRRIVSVPLRDGFDERLCASTIHRLSVPARRRHVYWTVGHGENDVSDYGDFGLSEIARELTRDGYRNSALDLRKTVRIPGDCALIAVAGAREDFSRAELGLLEDFLGQGGRLLVLANAGDRGGVMPLLPAWGVRPGAPVSSGTATTDGADVIVTDFPPHPVTERFRNARVTFVRPCSFVASAAAGAAGAGADRLGFAPLAKLGDAVLAAAVERGGGAGEDLAVRSTRLVVIGDAACVQNGQLALRAGANRDFLLNAVAYLAGNEALGVGGNGAGRFAGGLDRPSRIGYLLVSAVIVPLAVFLAFGLVALRRRFRR